MNAELGSLVAFVLIVNPFALALYLGGVMDDLDRNTFISVLVRATAMSLATFLVLAFLGEAFLVNVLGVRMQAMRIFGGTIFLNIAYSYVTKGYKATEMLRGDLDELPSEIALPFMIGAGSITQAIIIGKNYPPLMTTSILVAGMVFCVVVVLTFRSIRDHLKKKHERILNRYVNILCRANGLLIGAISVEMIIGGIYDLWCMKESV